LRLQKNVAKGAELPSEQVVAELVAAAPARCHPEVSTSDFIAAE
jgi:hypothetical protein